MNRVVAPQSTIATMDALWFQLVSFTQILKCELDGFSSGTMQELILLQRLERTTKFKPFSEAQMSSGNITVACARA